MIRESVARAKRSRNARSDHSHGFSGFFVPESVASPAAPQKGIATHSRMGAE
jgi:hypothetical protein